jgi:hypothetical protein
MTDRFTWDERVLPPGSSHRSKRIDEPVPEMRGLDPLYCGCTMGAQVLTPAPTMSKPMFGMKLGSTLPVVGS